MIKTQESSISGNTSYLSFPKKFLKKITGWRNILPLTGLVAFFVGGILFIGLLPIPFGFLFKGSFFLCVGGLLLTLFVLSLRLLISKRIWKKAVGAVFILIPIILLLIITIVVADHRILFLQGMPPVLTKDQWQEDLQYLVEKMEQKHPNLYSSVSRDVFFNAIKNIEERIPSLDSNQIMVEFFKVIALPNDAHSFPFIISPAYNLHHFPLKIYNFDNGWYVTDICRKYKDVIGSRVVKIGDVPMDEVYELYKPYLAVGNDFSKRERFCLIGLMAEWLQAQGIIENINKGAFTFESVKGEQYTVVMKPEKHFLWLYWYMFRRIDNKSSPFVLNRRRDAYVFEFLDESKILYFRFNAVVRESANETIEEFIQRLSSYVDTHDFNRMVIDLRNNGGGDGSLIFDLVDLIKNNEKINQRGKLFVIIGRNSLSAAVMFASMLHNNTKAIFVGKPTGQGPNFFSGPNGITLPYSKLEFWLSSRLNESSLSIDKRQWIEPDIPVQYICRDFLENKDPAMEAILNFQPSEVESIKLEDEVIQKICGRYVFSPHQILTIQKKDESLTFQIFDFNPASYNQIQSHLYPISNNEFLTDIRNVILQLPVEKQAKAASLIFKWGNTQRVIHRAPEGFKLPLEYIYEGKMAEGVELFVKNKEEHIRSNPSLETSLTILGYRHLRKEEYNSAIPIFKLIVEIFPQSSNAYDSLGEAYMLNGNRELAILNYEKSLELNPDNTNAVNMLKRLEKKR
jgi:tetratricopeptide (TPR) repeat protein